MNENGYSIFDTDSYKVTHWKQYPQGTEYIHSYLESRGGIFPKTIFFGLQYYLKKYLMGSVVSAADILEMNDMCLEHFGQDMLNIEGWYKIVDEHNGKLPISIHALPEGTISPVHTPLMTMENTDPELPWLTNWMETLLSMIWYPITVATQSYYMKQSILTHLDKTGTLEDIGFKLHDFGFRGVSSKETAGIGGVAHLVNFVGTDNMAALQIAKKYYNSKCAGFSIPASEHSTITSYGKDNELDAFRNMLQQYPTGLVACVSDSYDIYNACENLWGEKLHDEIMARDGTLVIRPDSGNPIEVVPKCLNILGDKFGYTENTKGYKVLDDHVRMIQGDGINRNSINDILQVLTDNKWSADNIAFGSGGALLQQLNRDTNMFAIKCSNATVKGIERDVYKSPITSIAKESKRGRFTGLTEVFKDGEILVEYTLDEIRERINNDR